MACDWITIISIIACITLGAIIGFGKLLTALTNKIFGKIVAVFICYVFGGMILNFNFMQEFMTGISDWIASGNNFFTDFLGLIHLEIIIYYVLLFVAAYWLIKLLAWLVRSVFEIEFMPVKIVNQVAGAVLFTGLMVLLALFIFQIIYWIGGNTAASFLESLDGSFLALDKLFTHNPLLGLVHLTT